MNQSTFTKNIERLINPIDVGGLHFIQSFNKYLPKKIQDQFVRSAAKQIPYMGFVVEPYATFLCYEITDIQKAKTLLPNGFELVKTRIFNDDEPKYYCIFGCFTAHTSAFWGSRVEFYIIAEDQNTKLLSWIIVDYDSNTISYDKKDGLRSPNSKHGVVTTGYGGKIYIDFPKDDKSRNISLEADIKEGVIMSLDQRLWLEGNLSIGYGSTFDPKDASIFSLKFDPREVESAVNIPLNNVNIETNTWYPGLFSSKPSFVLTFPYAQHFISDSPGASSKVMNRDDLIKSINNLDFKNIKTFSTKSFRIMFLVGGLVSLAITVTLLILLLIK